MPVKFSKDSFIGEWKIHVFVIGLLAIIFFRIYIMLEVSLKDNFQFVHNPWFPTPPFHLANWVKAWGIVGKYISNTVFVAITSILITFFFTIPAAYFFARFKVPGSTVFWYFFLILMMMPGIANLIPLFILVKQLGLLNTMFSLIVIGVSGVQVFQIFILRNFIEEIPHSLFEAAEMDGANHWQCIWHVVIPMSGPIISTLAILKTINVWNDYITPMVMIRDDARLTLSAGLVKLDGEYVKMWGEMMAGYSIASIPLVLIFLFTMRTFVKGLAAGAVKG